MLSFKILKFIKISPSNIYSIYKSYRKEYIDLSEMTRKTYYINYVILSYKLKKKFILDESLINAISKDQSEKEEVIKYFKKYKLKIDLKQNKKDNKVYNDMYNFLYTIRSYSNFTKINKSKKISFCLFNKSLELINNLIEETNSEKDSLFYYKKDNLFISSKKIEEKEKSDKEAKENIKGFLKKNDEEFKSDDVEFILKELIFIKDKTISWGKNISPICEILIELLKKISANKNKENLIKKENVTIVTNYYINLLNNNNKHYIINYLYNIIPIINSYNINAVLDSINVNEKFSLNDSLNKDSLPIVIYVYDRLELLKNKYRNSTQEEDNLKKYNKMISLKNWNKVMLEIETKNG